MKAALFKYHFKPHWTMVLLTVIAVGLFMRLGFWQLARAHEKQQMLKAVDVLSKQTPIDWKPSAALPKQYQQVHVKGHFLPTALLLDNQYYRHQFGYDVITPLVLDNGQVILIDRGFVPAGQHRQTLPHIDSVNDGIDCIGSAYYPSNKQWVLGPVLDKMNKKLAIIEQIDIPFLREFLHKSIYPFIIRLDSQSMHGFIRDWPVVAMPVARHYGYALQWFIMALVIVILFIVLNVKKSDV